jgi:hypothetical protein
MRLTPSELADNHSFMRTDHWKSKRYAAGKRSRERSTASFNQRDVKGRTEVRFCLKNDAYLVKSGKKVQYNQRIKKLIRWAFAAPIRPGIDTFDR